MKRIKIIMTALLAAMSLMFMFQPVLAANIDCSNPTTPQMRIKCGACAAAGGTCPAAPDNSISGTITTVVNLLSIAAGVIAVIMIIIAGLRYVTSAGSPEAAKGAKNTILYAIIGLVIVAVAQLVVHFVLNNVTTGTQGASGSSSSSTQDYKGGKPG